MARPRAVASRRNRESASARIVDGGDGKALLGQEKGVAPVATGNVEGMALLQQRENPLQPRGRPATVGICRLGAPAGVPVVILVVVHKDTAVAGTTLAQRYLSSPMCPASLAKSCAPSLTIWRRQVNPSNGRARRSNPGSVQTRHSANVPMPRRKSLAFAPLNSSPRLVCLMSPSADGINGHGKTSPVCTAIVLNPAEQGFCTRPVSR